MQSKLHSLYEALSNMILGYLFALLGQWIIFPYYDLEITFGDQLEVAAWFTLISLIRIYVLRRIYNRWSGVIWKRVKRGKNG